jgi:hypothetical protein
MRKYKKLLKSHAVEQITSISPQFYFRGSYFKLHQILGLPFFPFEDNEVEAFSNCIGDKYRGQVKIGQKNGFGILEYSSGSRYEGSFLDDQRSGFGTRYWDDGNLYEGGYSEDLAEGFGLRIYPSGNRYEGEFVKNKKEGRGIFYFKNGS